MEIVKQRLENLSKASRQKVNYSKYQIFFLTNISNEVANSLSRNSEIPRTKDLDKYLGVPLIQHRKSTTYIELLDRLKKRLAEWKANCLSLVGRITLAKTMLNSTLVYQMQMSILPASVTNELDKHTRHFI